MNHTEALPLFDAYVDGELNTAETLAFDEHVAGCSSCTTLVAARLVLVNKVRAAPLRFELPVAARRRLLDRPGLRNSRTGTWRPLAWIPAALAAGIVLCTGAFNVGADRAQAAALAQQFAAAHVRSLMSGQQVEVVSSDHHTVKPWFAGRLPFSPPVPELESAGYALVGGRLDYVGQSPCAALVYRAGAHVVTVFIRPRPASGGQAPRDITSDGYHVVTAVSGELRVVIVTDMGMEETVRFSHEWLSAANR